MTEEKCLLSDLYWLMEHETKNHNGGRKDYVVALKLAIDRVEDQYGIGMGKRND